MLLCLAVFGLVISACGGAPASAPAAPAPTATLAPTATPGRTSGIAYAALGASETFGVGANPVTNGYAYLVRDSLRLDAAHFADTGIPGTRLGDAYQTELTSALSIEPTVCTVFFGANDIRAGVTLAQFSRDLDDLVATLRRAGAHVLIIGLPRLEDLPAVRALHISGIDALVTQWNASMQAIADKQGAAFLNLDAFTSEIVAHPEDIAQDGLHPSNLGHARLAQIVYAALQQKGYTTA
jgi:lysophospholipase L1-like esterase